MKKVNIISKVIAICSLIAITSTSSFAHSGHDFSKLPMKWEFTKETKAKIESVLKVNKHGISSIGTSRLEQKFFNDYNVDVGNRFLAKVNGRTITLQRTSSGILIEEIHRFSNTTVPQIPVQKTMEVKKCL
jgi:predicted SpoU family rRNA methylase